MNFGAVSPPCVFVMEWCPNSIIKKSKNYIMICLIFGLNYAMRFLGNLR